jgi:hypothetical protein
MNPPGFMGRLSPGFQRGREESMAQSRTSCLRVNDVAPPRSVSNENQLYGKWSGRRLFGVLIILLPIFRPQTSSPQETLSLKGPPSCSSCQIVVERELSMGGVEGPGIGQFFHVARDSLGRFFVSNEDVPDEIGVYDSTGTYLQTLGRQGEGPGEWLLVRDISAVGGFLIVSDLMNARETVLDLHLNVIRTAPLVGDPLSLAFLSDSTKVANILIYSPERVGYPLHTIDAGGRITASFGYGGGVFRRDSESTAWRRLSTSSDGTVWSGHARQYVIEKWTITGERIQTVERSVDWFPPLTGVDSWSPDVPPDPQMAGIWEDPDRHLWVVVYVPDPEWREAMSPAQGGGYISLASDYLDMMVEVIDPGSGEVLVRHRFDLAGKLIGGGRMAAYREDEDGLPYLDVYKIRVDRGERR